MKSRRPYPLIQIVAMLAATVVTLMSGGEVTKYINGFAEKGASPDTIYNLGFQLFHRQGFPKQAIANALAEGYQGAKGKTPEQQQAIDQAAAFWAKEAAYWNARVQGPQNIPGNLPFFSRPSIGGRDQDIIPMTPAPKYPYR